MTYAPYDYVDLNINIAHGQPNQAYLDSAISTYWARSLYQRLTSVIELTVPETWEGSRKDFLLWLLFGYGFVGVINAPKYGYLFQPCTLGPDRDVTYQPTTFKVLNPYDSEISKDYRIGIDGELLKLTPDWSGCLDIIEKYAARLSFLYTSINTAIINSKTPPIFFARNKTGAAALNVMQSKIYNGAPYVILGDTKNIIYPDQDGKNDGVGILETHLSNDMIVGDLLEAETAIIKSFDQEVGIPTISEKKERLVTSEAETKVIDGTARSLVWFDCLRDSIDRIKQLYPNIRLDASLRYKGEDSINEETGEEEEENAV